MSIRNELDKLKSSDVYSLILFVLYKLRDIPEYSSISELAFILNKEGLLNLCEYFGGSTIKIPTIDELESVIYSLLMYQYIEVDKLSYDEAVSKIGAPTSKLRQIKKNYYNVLDILKECNYVV